MQTLHYSRMHVKFNTFFTTNDTPPSHFPVSKKVKSNSSNDLSCFHREHKWVLNTHGKDKRLNDLIKSCIRYFISITSPPAGRKRELQKEMAELHRKSNIASNQGVSFLAGSVKDCSKAVAKTDIENIDKKIHYAFQTLLLTHLWPKNTNVASAHTTFRN